MAARGNRNVNSMETILTFDNRDNQSQWSVEWSTTYVPGMDNAAGRGPRRREMGRRRLRLGALALSSALVMHCRVAASALTGGFILFYLSLVVSVALLANPLRHFEVYLGQWSISGPGRAFRIVPMLDGIGIAMCINCIVRAICCCAVAAIAMLYVLHSASDAKLPFTYCRDWDLKAYDPISKNVTIVFLREGRFSLATALLDDNITENLEGENSVGLQDLAWRKGVNFSRFDKPRQSSSSQTLQMCKESYTGRYPPLYSTPSYNFFYVEVVLLRPDYDYGVFNLPLLACILCIWIFMWILMFAERVSYGRLVWNNLYPWFASVPWVWAVCLLIAAARQVSAPAKILRQVFKVGGKEILIGFSDALEIALYIHSASTGTEIIQGKGLNHYASGHIDPQLNSDNVWHSCLLLLLAGLHCCGAATCAVADIIQPDNKATEYSMKEIFGSFVIGLDDIGDGAGGGTAAVQPRQQKQQLVWNNLYPWFASVPWVWAVCLLIAAARQVSAPAKILRQVFKVGGKEILIGFSDALEIALYIHSASTGTEIIQGKGLNHYASGHIDPQLNSDNVWHSCLLLLLAGLHCCGAATCAVADIIQPDNKATEYSMKESTLWIIPMYSKCTSAGLYSHATSSIIFGGLCFSYVLVAYTSLKTALHTIFEYRVKLVFVEQVVVAALMVTCMTLSLPIATTGGVAFLESVDALMSGLTMPLVCLLELTALLLVYHSHDFVSDMDVATEENTCSTRIGTQWQIIPFIIIILLISKIVALTDAEMPVHAICLSLVPTLSAALAVPLRALHNAYDFLRPAPRRGT